MKNKSSKSAPKAALHKTDASGSLRIDVKKVGSFLKSIDGAEYLFMRHCMDMRDSIQNLIKRHELTKADFCERFKIKPAKYQDYIMGNYNYSVHDMACLNAAFMELEAEKLKDEVPVQIAKRRVTSKHINNKTIL